MSKDLDDPHATCLIVGRQLFWLNLLILVGVFLWAASLPFGWFYTSLNQSKPLPGGYANSITTSIWLLIGPLMLFNTVWLVYTARRWHAHKAVAEKPLDHDSEPPGGCSVGFVFLTLGMGALMLCMIPDALWFPLGAHYQSFPYVEQDLSLLAFPNSIGPVVQSIMGMLALLNLLWVIYALWWWRTLPLHPGHSCDIPEGATDLFTKQPPTSQVRRKDGFQGDS